MVVKSLSLYNFKNHREKAFAFSPQINCFVGANGAGKTNVLDALHYLSAGRSFLGNPDLKNILEGEDFFSIAALVEAGEDQAEMLVNMAADAKKTIKKNGKKYEKLADHFGYLPCVVISPYDANLISDSGEGRRKFLDAMIAQTDRDYLHHVITYDRALRQRNALLKYFAKNRLFDADSLEIYDAPLAKSGAEIYRKRRNFVKNFEPSVSYFYEILSGGKEKITISLSSDLEEIFDDENTEQTLTKLLQETVPKDRVLTYTSSGPHKDDLIFWMGENLLKKYGSQGQQKTFLISLKLAQIRMIKEITGKTPILLLDDIFDKLDDSRVSQLIALLNRENFGQIFLTDTHRNRTESIVRRINEESLIFEI